MHLRWLLIFLPEYVYYTWIILFSKKGFRLDPFRSSGTFYSKLQEKMAENGLLILDKGLGQWQYKPWLSLLRAIHDSEWISKPFLCFLAHALIPLSFSLLCSCWVLRQSQTRVVSNRWQHLYAEPLKNSNNESNTFNEEPIIVSVNHQINDNI